MFRLIAFKYISLSHFSAMESSKSTHLSVAGIENFALAFVYIEHKYSEKTKFLNKQTDFKWPIACVSLI